MSPMQWIILFGFLLALLAILAASEFVYKRHWLHCLRCDHWFSDCGDYVKDLPGNVPESNIHGFGVCPDCSKDVEFNRE